MNNQVINKDKAIVSKPKFEKEFDLRAYEMHLETISNAIKNGAKTYTATEIKAAILGK